MIITGFYVKLKRKVSAGKMKKLRCLLRFCGTTFMALGAGTAPVSANPITEIAKTTFGPGGPGVVIAELMLIAVVGWLCGYIARAVGKSQIADMISAATVFSCIAIIAGVALNAINTVGKFLG